MPSIPQQYSELQERIVAASTMQELVDIQDVLRQLLRTIPDTDMWIVESLSRNITVQSWKIKKRK